MIFSQAELICLNSVINDEEIFGTHFKAPIKVTEEYTGTTIASLVKKGLLDSNQKPTQLFTITTRVLEEYKKCKEYLFLNKSRIGLSKDGVVIISPREENYELVFTEKAIFYDSLLKEYPQYQDEKVVEERIRSIPPKIWNTEIDKKGLVENYLWIQSMKKTEIGTAQIAYSVDGEIYVYDTVKEEERLCGAVVVRELLQRKLGMTSVKKGEKNNGSIS